MAQQDIRGNLCEFEGCPKGIIGCRPYKNLTTLRGHVNVHIRRGQDFDGRFCFTTRNFYRCTICNEVSVGLIGFNRHNRDMHQGTATSHPTIQDGPNLAEDHQSTSSSGSSDSNSSSSSSSSSSNSNSQSNSNSSRTSRSRSSSSSHSSISSSSDSTASAPVPIPAIINNNHRNQRRNQNRNRRPTNNNIIEPDIPNINIHQAPEPDINNVSIDMHRNIPVYNVSKTVLPAFALAFIRIASLYIQAINDHLEDENPEEFQEHILAYMHLPLLCINSVGLPHEPQQAIRYFTNVINHPDPKKYVNAVCAILQRQHAEHRIQQYQERRQPRNDYQQQQIKIKIIKKRAIGLIQHGQLSKALAVVEDRNGTMLSPAECLNPATLEIIHRLHPRADPDLDSVPINPNEGSPQLQLEINDILETLNKLQRQSASGMSPWTNDLIKQLAFENNEVQLLILELFQHIINGHQQTNFYWSTSRMAFISKETGGIRPIAVGETWYRFLARIVARKIATELGTYFMPIQFGVGIPGGSEHIAHTLRLVQEIMNAKDILDEDEIQDAEEVNPCILSLDATNAFNTIRRRFVFEEVFRVKPEIAKLVVWVYGNESPLYLSNGHLVTTSATGLRQGDALASPLYGLGTHPVWIEVKQEVPEILALVVYVDDVNGGGESQHMKRLKAVAAPKLAARGIILNDPKCILYDRTADYREYYDPESGLTITGIGIKCVGVPFCVRGDEFTDSADGRMYVNYATAKAFRIIEKVVQTLSAIKTILPAQYGLPLLKYCITSRVMYLLRTAGRDVTAQIAKEFDEQVDGLISYYLQVTGPLSHRASTIRSLTQNFGGLGITSASLTRDLAFAASFLSFASQALNIAPELWRLFTSYPGAMEDTHRYLDNCIASFDYLDEDGAHMGPMPDPRDSNIVHPEVILTPAVYNLRYRQHMLTQRRYKGIHQAVLASFPANSSLKPWFLAGSAPATIAWFSSSMTTDQSRHLTAEVFSMATSMRLLQPHYPNMVHQPRVRCLCGTVIDWENDHLHCLHCNLSRADTIQLHNKVADHVAAFHKAILAPTTTIVREGLIAGARPETRADVTITTAQHQGHIDVVIGNPAALYMRRDASEHGDHCNNRHEAEKRGHYVSRMGRVASEAVKPFAIDATGRYGATARKIIEDVCGPPHMEGRPDPLIARARRRLIDVISSDIQRFNCRRLKSFLGRSTIVEVEEEAEEEGEPARAYLFLSPTSVGV